MAGGGVKPREGPQLRSLGGGKLFQKLPPPEKKRRISRPQERKKNMALTKGQLVYISQARKRLEKKNIKLTEEEIERFATSPKTVKKYRSLIALEKKIEKNEAKEEKKEKKQIKKKKDDGDENISETDDDISAWWLLLLIIPAISLPLVYGIWTKKNLP